MTTNITQNSYYKDIWALNRIGNDLLTKEVYHYLIESENICDR
jgi:hypothetical protein